LPIGLRPGDDGARTRQRHAEESERLRSQQATLAPREQALTQREQEFERRQAELANRIQTAHTDLLKQAKALDDRRGILEREQLRLEEARAAAERRLVGLLEPVRTAAAQLEAQLAERQPEEEAKPSRVASRPEGEGALGSSGRFPGRVNGLSHASKDQSAPRGWRRRHDRHDRPARHVAQPQRLPQELPGSSATSCSRPARAPPASSSGRPPDTHGGSQFLASFLAEPPTLALGACWIDHLHTHPSTQCCGDITGNGVLERNLAARGEHGVWLS
jgi:hypothetical protein